MVNEKCTCCGKKSAYMFYFIEGEILCRECYIWARDIVAQYLS